jgi:hypothetical protein
MTTFPQFVRRRNRDSSIDSICTKCFLTIASVTTNEDDLAAHEEKHICDPYEGFSRMHADSQNRTNGATRQHTDLQAN